jgi:cobalt-zinc-cadmium efflux system outer membrane protein
MLSRSVIIFFSGTLLFFNTALCAESSLTPDGHNTYMDAAKEQERMYRAYSSGVEQGASAAGVLKPANNRRINLPQAINKTFAHNPELRVFSYALKAQSGRQLQASLAASPEMSFVVEDVLGSRNFKGMDSAQATLGIAWVLEGKVRQGYIDVASAGSSSLSKQADIKRLDAAAETARLYIIALANQARLNNAAKTAKLAQATVIAVKKRVAAGKAPAAELARARAELARRQLGHEDIEHELSSAIHVLAAQWGETQPGFTQVAGSIFNLPIIVPFETLKTRLAQSPEFTRLMSDKRLLQARLKLAESQSRPEWRVNLGVRHFETTNDQALVAGISIPFGERSRNRGRIVETRENLSQTQAKVDALKVRFETTLYVLSQELEHALHTVNAYSDNIIPQLEKALQETRRAYNLGRYGYLEWRSVQADLLDARSALVEASVNAHLKVIQIEHLTGVPVVQPVAQLENKS